MGDTYSNVRDNWEADEVEAWLAYLEAEATMAAAKSRKGT